MTNYNVRLAHQQDLELFSGYIKDAVVDSFHEFFGRERLREITLRYDDFIHKSYRGLAHSDGSIEVRQTEDALQLAGTIVHELAHQLVGVNHNHDDLWHKAGNALGLVHCVAEGQRYKPDHFRTDLLLAIENALSKLVKEHSEIVYSADLPIPMPKHWGMPDCPDQRDDCEHGHAKHVMQFQVDGVRWMLANAKPGLLYADDPGLGKTVGAMMYVNAVHPKTLLIICPNNVKLVWRDHFKDMVVHQELQDNLEVAYSTLWTFSPVTIMNYEAARKYKDSLRSMQWDLVIFDEMHYLKTPNSQRSRACFNIKGNKALGLTGTPIVNYIDEIFPLIHYLDRENWPEFGTFASRYMSQGDRFGRNLQEFNSRLRATIMLRRFKKDVLSELPKKRRQMVQIEVTDDVRELIEEENRLWNEVQKDVNDYEQVKMLNAMRNESDTAIDDIDWAKLIEELQMTKKYAFERMAIIAHQIGLAKVPHAISFITDMLENKEKVAVFGHHRDVLTKIADHFKPGSVLLLGGGANQAEATAMASRRFSNDPDCRVFVGGITLAAGYSLKGTSTVVFVEEDWVPGIMTQAEDRCHGIGRGDADALSLMIHHLCFEDSLDTHKAKKTIRKQKSIDRATGKV